MSGARSFSLYRGYSRIGVGEGPGRPVAHGEQYLAAEGPLATDQTLLDTARAWMTLDATASDYGALGAHFEAWSYFSARDFRFVVRLTAADRYDVRNAFFAHARVWHKDAFGGGQDPGVLIGSKAAFERPWRNNDAHTTFEPTDIELAALWVPTSTETRGLISLVAHLYQACRDVYPVILAAPITDFVSSSPLHGLVAFARAALPLSVKRDCGIRIYTRHPDVYLTDAHATLVVVPDDEAANALAVRRDATLLDRNGEKIAGRDARAPFARYAEETVRRASDRPDALLSFAERVDRRRWSQTGTEDTSEVGFLYAVGAAARSATDLNRFVRSLYKTLGERPDAPPRQELLTLGDLKLCSDELLEELLLKIRTTPNARALQRTIEDVAEKRVGVDVDRRFDEWWNSGALAERPARIRRVIELGDRKFLSPTKLAVLAGASVDDLAAAIDDQEVLPPLMRLTDAGYIGSEWVGHALGIADGQQLVELALWIVEQSASRIGLQEARWRALDVLIARNIIVREGLAARIAALLPRTPPDDLKMYLALNELLHRSGDVEAPNRVDRLAQLTGAEQRREIVAALDESRWTALARFRVPKDWEADTVELLVDRETRRPRRTIEELGRLLAYYGTSTHATQRALIGLIDASMTAEPRDTTSLLISQRRWLTWRMATASSDEHVQRSASHWLVAAAWRQGLEPYLEEWKEVVQLLERSLAADDLVAVASQLPGIHDFEDEQWDDLVRLAADFVGLAVLALRKERLWIAALARMSYLADADRSKAPQLTRGLLEWISQQQARGALSETALRGLLQKLNELAPTHGVELSPSKEGRLLAAKAAELGFRSAARALDSSLTSGLVERMVGALRNSSAKDDCWKALESDERGALLLVDVADHVTTLAARADAQPLEDLEKNGWDTLVGVVSRYVQALQLADLHQVTSLPVLQLAAALSSSPSLGQQAARIASFRTAEQYRIDPDWWRAVFAGFTMGRQGTFRRPADRPEAALALIWSSVPEDAHPAIREALERTAVGRETEMPIADIVTPFSPQEDQSANQTVVAHDHGEILVLGARRLDSKALQKLCSGSNCGPEQIGEFLRARGGGLTAYLARDGQLKIDHAENPGYKRPRSCAVVSRGGVYALRGIEDVLTLKSGDHILLPTDAECEQRLRSFLEVLDYLPSDRAFLVLNQIRRPSLEWRVDELEKKLAASRSRTKSPSSRRGLLAKTAEVLDVRRWNDWVFASVTVALIVLVAIFLVLQWRPAWLGLGSRSTPGTAVIETLDPASVTSGAEAFTLTVNGTGFLPDWRVQFDSKMLPTTFVSPTRMTAYVSEADIATPGPRTVKVVEREFGGKVSEPVTLNVTPTATAPRAAVPPANEPSPTSEAPPFSLQLLSPAAGWLSAKNALLEAMPTGDGDSPARRLHATHVAPVGFNNRRFAWAVLKLQLLRDKKVTGNEDVFKSHETWTRSRQIAREALGTRKDGIVDVLDNLDAKSRLMLAYASCVAWGQPGFAEPVTSGVMRFDSRSCADIAAQSESAAAAMIELTNWIRTQ